MSVFGGAALFVTDAWTEFMGKVVVMVENVSMGYVECQLGGDVLSIQFSPKNEFQWQWTCDASHKRPKCQLFFVDPSLATPWGFRIFFGLAKDDQKNGYAMYWTTGQIRVGEELHQGDGVLKKAPLTFDGDNFSSHLGRIMLQICCCCMFCAFPLAWFGVFHIILASMSGPTKTEVTMVMSRYEIGLKLG